MTKSKALAQIATLLCVDVEVDAPRDWTPAEVVAEVERVVDLVQGYEDLAQGYEEREPKLTAQASAAIDRLVSTGLFGLDRDDCIERLICDRLIELKREGWWSE